MGVLDADNLDIDPYQLFDSWFAEAKKSEINDADAMAIASVDSDGMPSVRMVLLKEVTSEGFVFYTNYTSRKASELLATGKAAFVMHWKSLRRQVRVSGKVEQVPAAQSDAYFASRPRAVAKSGHGHRINPKHWIVEKRWNRRWQMLKPAIHRISRGHRIGAVF